YESVVRDIRAQMNLAMPEAMAPQLARAVALLAGAWPARRTPSVDDEAGWRHDIHAELRVLYAPHVRASGTVLDGVTAHERVVPGQTVDVDATVWNAGSRPAVVSLMLDVNGWSAGSSAPITIAPQSVSTHRFNLRIP